MPNKSPGDASGTPVWGSRLSRGPHAGSLSYTSGWDVRPRPAADERLASYDLETNAAHLLMLVSTGILGREDGAALAAGLLNLAALPPAELLRPGSEDIHMSVEEHLTAALGPRAGAIHTARSRNDQVATDLRLWLRDATLATGQSIARLALGVAAHARENVHVPCPGFTHVQPAMVTTWGHWSASWLPPLARQLREAVALLDEINESPLGAAAGFGTSWPINRTVTASLLGFRAPSGHSFDGTATRGELEGRLAFLLSELMGLLARISQDLIFVSTPPRDWVRLPDEFVTGSSIMPNKRNPDVAEVTLGRAALARGYVTTLLASPTYLAGGYNRGLQWTKYVAFDAVDNAEGAADLFAELITRLEVNPQSMLAACRVGFLEAADLADRVALRSAVPFRTAYKLVGSIVAACDADGVLRRDAVDAALTGAGLAPFSDDDWAWLTDPVALIASRDQSGSPKPGRVLESLDASASRIRSDAATLLKESERLAAARESLWSRVETLAAGAGA